MNFEELKKCLEENKINIEDFKGGGKIEIKTLIGEDNNNLERINKFEKIGGIYIFEKAGEIVYIGKAGHSHGLKDRIQKQLNCNPSNSNLAKNINEEEKCNCNKEEDNNKTTFDKKCLKECLKSHTDKIIIIPIEGDDRTISLLETILIYQYNPKYNKD